MSDETSTATPDAATVEAASTPANPFALGLGWIGGILLAIGVIVLLVGAGRAADPNTNDDGLGQFIVGGVLTTVGFTAILLLLTALTVAWQLRRRD